MRHAFECVHAARRQYSATRLFEFRDYGNSASQLRVALVLLLYCSPALAIIVLLDMVPLQDPSDGWRANWAYWVRVTIGASIIALMLLTQVQFAIPEISFTRKQVVAISLGTGVGCSAALMLLAEVWRFPVPFAFTIGCVPMTLIHNTLVVGTLGTTDKARLDKYFRFSNSVGIQGTMLLVYPLYNALFVSLKGVPQLALVLLLPMIKHTFKHLAKRTHFAAEDLITASQTSVDFFDALYMTKCMQSGTTLAVGCAIIVVDTAQNYAAILSLTRQTRTLVKEKNKISAAVTETLRLLHLSESVIVVEYIETVVPMMYALYTAVLFQLPNARYYQDMQSLSHERFRSAELNILAYAFMELLSMVYVHYMLKRHFGFSVLDQLAFTLERDWPVIQCCLVTWSMIVFQYLLVHNGVDFAFILG